MSASYYHCVSEKHPLNALTIGDAIRKLQSECPPDLELLVFTGKNERITVHQLVTQVCVDPEGELFPHSGSPLLTVHCS